MILSIFIATCLFAGHGSSFSLRSAQLRESGGRLGTTTLLLPLLARRIDVGTSRDTCGRCARSPAVCVCPALPAGGPVLTPLIRLLIVQHPAEAKRKVTSSVPLIPLCVSACQVFRGICLDQAPGAIEAVRCQPWCMCRQ